MNLEESLSVANSVFHGWLYLTSIIGTAMVGKWISEYVEHRKIEAEEKRKDREIKRLMPLYDEALINEKPTRSNVDKLAKYVKEHGIRCY